MVFRVVLRPVFQIVVKVVQTQGKRVLGPLPALDLVDQLFQVALRRQKKRIGFQELDGICVNHPPHRGAGAKNRGHVVCKGQRPFGFFAFDNQAEVAEISGFFDSRPYVALEGHRPATVS